MKIQDQQITLKIAFSGQKGTGITSLLTRQSINYFPQEFQKNNFFDFRVKSYKISNVNVKVQFWGTAGSQRFRIRIRPNHFKGADAILFCLDLTDKNSFLNLDKDFQQIQQFDFTLCPIYLIGCKSDLKREVFNDEIEIISEKHHCKYFETSSKQNFGVNECFQSIVQQCKKRKLQQICAQYSKSIELGSFQKKSKQQKKSCF